MCYFVANLWHVALDMYYVDGQKMDGQSIPISITMSLIAKKSIGIAETFVVMVFVRLRWFSFR